MGILLTKEEWKKIDEPFYWITHEKLIFDKEKKSNNTLKEIIIKWCKKNLNGWFYYEDDYWMFSDQNDLAKLKLIIVSGYFEEEYGFL